ncbi:MAG: SDR family oxidoreductase [Betaproteobacteria bacterium]|nr:SDR family oxidoreductase [Betaproteobacteria bacterium]
MEKQRRTRQRRGADNEFNGIHAVVTGGGRGIGAAIASSLAAAGAILTLIGRNEERLRKHRDELRERFHARVDFEIVDLVRPEQIAPAFSSLVARRGPAGILVNNAGAVETASFLKTSEDDLDRMLSVNLKQVVFCTQAVLPAMIKMNYGRIVNVASVAGVRGQAFASAYCISKHAVIGLTRALAWEFAKTGITVNAVCPVYTETELVDRVAANVAAKTGQDVNEIKRAFAQRNPAGRLMKPVEVADTVMWLCSRRSTAINGQAILVG